MWSICFCLGGVIPGDWPHWWKTLFFTAIRAREGKKNTKCTSLTCARWIFTWWACRWSTHLTCQRTCFLVFFPHAPPTWQEDAQAQQKKGCPPPSKPPFEVATHCRLVVAKWTVSVSAHWALCRPQGQPPCQAGTQPASVNIDPSVHYHATSISTVMCSQQFIFCFFQSLNW